MIEKLNAALVEAVRTHVPKNTNTSFLVGETLHMGREAAYRRLNGKVPFSFGEAAVLSSRLNFSLDKTIRIASACKVIFELRFNDFHAPLDVFNRLLDQDINFLREVASDSTAELASATNSLPPECYLRYPTLANFKLFKWLYQHKMTGVGFRSFEELQVPARLSDNYREYIAASQQVPHSIFVFDANGFRHWVNAIRAYRAMHLMSCESLHRLREELLLLLADLERIADEGHYPNGNKVDLYYSDVDIECTYRYFRTGCCRMAGIGIFSLNALRTSDEVMYEYVSSWIRNQSRFSTLISCSGEMQRIRYFQQQREIVSALG